MFTTKSDIDRHVRTSFSKLSENEKNMRGFAIAKLYFRIGEYSVARQYLYGYLSVKGDCAAAHKLLGHCYEKLKMPDKAISSYQRSLQLDSKQSDVITSMSNLLLSVDSKVNINKIKYVIDLAESEHLQSDTILNLKLKLLNKEKPEQNQTHDILMKEIIARPTLPSLRIRLIKNLLEQNRVDEAFKQAYDTEIRLIENFQLSIDWYNTIGEVLRVYKNMPEKNYPRTWNYWLLSIMSIEKQIFLQLSETTVMQNSNNLSEVMSLLYEYDQMLNTVSGIIFVLCPERELAIQLLSHYRGQWCLHAASVLFAKEKILDKNQWKNTIRNAVPLLLHAFHAGIADTQENWLRNSGETSRQLIQLWNRQGAFRCCQAGRTLLSCITDARGDLMLETVLTICSDKLIFKSESDLLENVRKICSDTSWRRAVYRNLFAGEHLEKSGTSYFVENSSLAEPVYELPTQSNLENYEEIAQWLYPSSLKFFVYLGLGIKNLNHLVCHPFNQLNFSTVNLTNCNAGSLNQLDMETYLYAVILHARRILEIEKRNYEQYCVSTYPLVMPYANIAAKLCTEEHIEWWDGAYKLSRNLQIDDLSKVRATIQHGIEAVRAVGSPKISSYILFELGEIFLNRANASDKPSQKEFLELRAEKLYKQGLEIIKLTSRGNAGPRGNYFRYIDESEMLSKINYKAERAVAFLAKKHFLNGDYEGCIDELSEIKLPYAAYFQAEAYKHLDKSNKTPRKSKKLYIEKARECLNNTAAYLNDPNIDANHPLRGIIEQERHRINSSNDYMSDDVVANGSSHELKNAVNNEVAEKYNREKTDLRFEELLNKTSELCLHVKEVNQSLQIIKEDVAELKNIDMFNMKSEIIEINTKLLELLSKKTSIIREEDTQELENLWEEELTNQVLAANTTGSQFNLPRIPLNFPQSTTPMQYPHLLQQQITQSNPYNPLYNTMYPMYMYPPAIGNVPQVTPQQHPQNKNWMFPQGSADMSPLITDPRASLSSIQPMLQNHQPQLTNQMQQQQLQQQPAFNVVQPQPEITKLSQSTVNDMLTTSSLLKTIPPYNTTPLDKSPPINVVITNSDPLPIHNTVSQQPPLSVTIPYIHIKNNSLNNPPLNTSSIQQQPNVVQPVPNEIPKKPLIVDNPNESLLYNTCAKLYKYLNNEWREIDADILAIKRDKITGKCWVQATKNERRDAVFKHDITFDTNMVGSIHDSRLCEWNGRENSDNIKYRGSFNSGDDAKQFYTEFSKVKNLLPKPEIKSSIVFAASTQSISTPTTTIFSMNSTSSFGGFTFSSTPKFTTPKPVESEPGKIGTPDTNTTPVKPTTNLFSTLSFGITNTDPAKQFADFDKFKPTTIASTFPSTFSSANQNGSFGGGLGEPPKLLDTSLNRQSNTSIKSHHEDEDDYVPTAQFQPVIPLPELIDVKTGEENEEAVFDERAKLLRFDAETKEWKERGLGQMKILIDKNDPQRVRLLMRREKILKLCCNQLLTKDTKINVISSETKVKYARWCGKDFSENELRDEIFNIRFKTEEQLDRFVDVIRKAQSKMSDDVVPTNIKKDQEKPSVGFGNKFKSQIGSWDCPGCYINNKGADLYCVACDSPKDSTVPKKEAKSLLSTPGTAKFSFGIKPDGGAGVQGKEKQPTGFGDKFKPQTGSWDCQSCYINNKAADLYCMACDAPKDSTVPKKEAKSLLSTPNTGKFSFGIKPEGGGFQFGTLPASTPNVAVNLSTPVKTVNEATPVQTPVAQTSTIANSATSIILGATSTTGTPKFGFGGTGLNLSSTATTGPTNPTVSTFSFGGLTNTGQTSAPFSFAPSVVAPAQSSTIAVEATNEKSFNFQKGKSFDFVFQPKSPGKVKSPQKEHEAADHSDTEVVEEEENNAYFTPVIPLPDKIVVKTGEEDEEVLYSHRAKLYRFVDGEWKERGLGDVKILKHNESKKIRVVMRREQIFKICLNHFLTHDIEYKIKDDKSWHFVVNDFSEGVLEIMNFCLRFKTHELSTEFKAAIDNALKMVPQSDKGANDDTGVAEQGNIKQSEQIKIVLTEEEKKLIGKLKLPSNFFDNKNVNCPGCRGCRSEEFVFPTVDNSFNRTIVEESNELPYDLQGLDINKMLNAKPKTNAGLNDLSGSGDQLKKSLSVENNQQAMTASKNLFGGIGSNQFTPFSGSSIFSQNNSIKFGSGGVNSTQTMLKDDNVSEEDNEKAEHKNLNIPTTVFKLSAGGNNNSIFSPATSTTPNTFGSPSTAVLAPSNLATKFSFTAAASTLEKPISSEVASATTTTTTTTSNTIAAAPKSIFGTSGGFLFGNASTFTFGGTSPFGTNTSASTITTSTSTITSTENIDKQNQNTTDQINQNQKIDYFKTPVLAKPAEIVQPPQTMEATKFSGFTTFAKLVPNEGQKIVPENIFKTDSSLSFASLATTAPVENSAFKKENVPSSGFFGLTNNDDFSSFSGAAKMKFGGDGISPAKLNESDGGAEGETDTGYDPHYEPIIELPEEIVVKTGEEEEKKLFGERSKLYRFDPVTKEWKERGVGELKILHHEEQGTYRLLLRREQIHKLVLNHSVTTDFVFNPMPNSTGNSYCWATLNYSEEFPEGQVENLAVRFKNVDIAKRFEGEIDKCLEQLKSRSDLEPEDD